jgi:hypothetical protein
MKTDSKTVQQNRKRKLIATLYAMKMPIEQPTL